MCQRFPTCFAPHPARSPPALTSHTDYTANGPSSSRTSRVAISSTQLTDSLPCLAWQAGSKRAAATRISAACGMKTSLSISSGTVMAPKQTIQSQQSASRSHTPRLGPELRSAAPSVTMNDRHLLWTARGARNHGKARSDHYLS
jgi:hypothetical protein